MLGPARSVYAELNHVDLPDGRTDCAFVVVVTHAGGVRSHLSSTKLNRIRERELRAYGSAGAYASRGTDVQAQAVFAGLRPAELGPALGVRARGAVGHPAHRRRRRARAARTGRVPGPVPAVWGECRVCVRPAE
jgi:hypothetical protein